MIGRRSAASLPSQNVISSSICLYNDHSSAPFGLVKLLPFKPTAQAVGYSLPRLPALQNPFPPWRTWRLGG
jgi:hypothetical protein